MYNQQYYQNPVMGYVAPNRPQARYTQPVTAEMSKMVLTSDDELSVKISPTDKIKNMCTHKFPGTQTIALVETPETKADGTVDRSVVTCRVCGEKFHMVENTDQAHVTALANEMLDVMQSAKTLYLDMPEEFAKEYFQIITLVKRIPQVFAKAANNFAQYEVSSNPMTAFNGMNSFQQVNGFIGGYNMGGFAPGYGAPMGGVMPYGVPYGQQAPVYAQPQAQTPWTVNEYGQPVPAAMAPVVAAPAPGENPLMYNAPAPVAGVAPAAAPAAGVAPAAQTGDVTQVKAFSV